MLSVITRIEKQKSLIESIINSQLQIYLNYFDTFIFNLFNKYISQNKPPPHQHFSSSSKLKLIKAIKGYCWVGSMCFLRDGRLVSGGKEGIKIYHQYTPCVFIKEDYSTYSVCGLKNGNLASSDGNGDIRIYEIYENEYKHIRTLKGHTERVYKIIELEDSRLCSCSEDSTIRIWDNNYQLIKALKAHKYGVRSIIEMNYYIISSVRYDEDDEGVRIWNKETYKLIKFTPHIYCCNNNGLSKLKENAIILGGDEKLFVLDILSFQTKSFEDKRLGGIRSILVLREDEVLIGNGGGDIIRYDLLSNQIIFTQSIHNTFIYCIIKTEDNQIISCDSKGNINICG